MERHLDGYMFKGTRIPISLLFSYIKDGLTVYAFLEDFPSVTNKDVNRVLTTVIDSMKAGKEI